MYTVIFSYKLLIWWFYLDLYLQISTKMKTLFNFIILNVYYKHWECATHNLKLVYLGTLQYTFKIHMLVILSVVTVPFNNIKCVAKGTHATGWSPLVCTASIWNHMLCVNREICTRSVNLYTRATPIVHFVSKAYVYNVDYK